MAIVEKIDLEDDGSGAVVLEIYDSGQQILRGADGRVIKSHLPPELASERAKAPRGNQAAADKVIDALLRHYGADLDNPELRLLAGMVVDGKYYSIPSLSLLRRLVGVDNSGEAFKLVNENMIEYNGRVFVHSNLSRAGAVKLLRAVELANQAAAAEKGKI